MVSKLGSSSFTPPGGASAAQFRGRLKVLRDGGRHDDPELRAEPEQDEEPPVTRRLAHDVHTMPTHRVDDPCTYRRRTLKERYFVAHAKVRNAIKLAPIAVQTHTDMTSPSPPFPY